MPQWEFLIQREGSRGWKSIKQPNLQLIEGRYRIVASTHLTKTEIHTRITHQTTDVELAQRRSRSRTRVTNADGLIVVMPFNTLQPGNWQFVCSGGDEPSNAWHQILKLKVLSKVQTPPPPPPKPISIVSSSPSTDEDTSPFAVNQADNWGDELARLLEQLVEEEQPIAFPSTAKPIVLPPCLTIQPMAINPEQILVLEQTTFDVISTDRFTVYGSCNLRKFGEKILRKVTIDKLLICLRNPDTSKIMVAIESPIPPSEPTFAFRGELTLPQPLTTNRLLGEVNLYDRYNIQLASICFQVNISSAREHVAAPSFPDSPDRTNSDILGQLGRELGIPETTVKGQEAIELPDVFKNTPSQPQPMEYTPAPGSYQKEFLFEHNRRVTPSPPRKSPTPTHRATKNTTIAPKPPEEPEILSGELLFDIDLSAPILERPLNSYDTDTLEIVVES
jgi:hypothetical protein